MFDGVSADQAEQRGCDRYRKWWRSLRDWDADRAEAASVISIGNCWDTQVLKAFGRGGVLACKCFLYVCV